MYVCVRRSHTRTQLQVVHSTHAHVITVHGIYVSTLGVMQAMANITQAASPFEVQQGSWGSESDAHTENRQVIVVTLGQCFVMRRWWNYRESNHRFRLQTRRHSSETHMYSYFYPLCLVCSVFK